MIRSCIFDLDGTLLNTVESMKVSMNTALTAIGLPEIGSEETMRFVGNGYRLFTERALRFAGDTELLHLEEAGRMYKEALIKNASLGLHAYEGIKEMLLFLKNRGIRTAVLSNKPHERTVEATENIFGRNMFDKIYGEREGIPLKPDPTALLSLLKELETAPEEALYFGDSEADMEVGEAAGVRRVAVLWGFRAESVLRALRPDFVISRPQEVEGILKVLEKTESRPGRP